jgi:hypothetical protein
MKIDPNSPAFPRPSTEISDGSPGLPTRLHIAIEAMKGMRERCPIDLHPRQIAGISTAALAQADSLIAEYNRTEEKPNA